MASNWRDCAGSPSHFILVHGFWPQTNKMNLNHLIFIIANEILIAIRGCKYVIVKNSTLVKDESTPAFHTSLNGSVVWQAPHLLLLLVSNWELHGTYPYWLQIFEVESSKFPVAISHRNCIFGKENLPRTLGPFQLTLCSFISLAIVSCAFLSWAFFVICISLYVKETSNLVSCRKCAALPVHPSSNMETDTYSQHTLR